MLNSTTYCSKFTNFMKMVETDRLFYGVGEVRSDVTFPINQDILGKISNGFPLGVKRFNYRNRKGDYLPLLCLTRISHVYDKVMNSSQELIGNDMEWSHRAHIVNLIATKE